MIHIYTNTSKTKNFLIPVFTPYFFSKEQFPTVAGNTTSNI